MNLFQILLDAETIPKLRDSMISSLVVVIRCKNITPTVPAIS